MIDLPTRCALVVARHWAEDDTPEDVANAVLAEAGVAEMQARIATLEGYLRACRAAVANKSDDPRRKVRAIVLDAFGGDPDDAWPKEYGTRA